MKRCGTRGPCPRTVRETPQPAQEVRRAISPTMFPRPAPRKNPARFFCFPAFPIRCRDREKLMRLRIKRHGSRALLRRDGLYHAEFVGLSSRTTVIVPSPADANAKPNSGSKEVASQPSPIAGVASVFPLSASTMAIFLFPPQPANKRRFLRSMDRPVGSSQSVSFQRVLTVSFSDRRPRFRTYLRCSRTPCLFRPLQQIRACHQGRLFQRPRFGGIDSRRGRLCPFSIERKHAFREGS